MKKKEKAIKFRQIHLAKCQNVILCFIAICAVLSILLTAIIAGGRSRQGQGHGPWTFVFISKFMDLFQNSKIEQECPEYFFREAAADVSTQILWENLVNHTDVPIRRQETFRIILVPHSHVDPGWTSTFLGYYNTKVSRILSNAVEFLTKHEDMKYIWSESSFLELWWRNASETQKSDFKKYRNHFDDWLKKITGLVNNGQLEISSGSWTMTDEATTYFWASIDNLIEGHAFLEKEIGVRPNTSWSVDPFGHGPVVPYLMKLSGISNLVIGRFHIYIKNYMRDKNNHLMVFKWRQLWDAIGEHDTLVQALAYHYTTGDSCGPRNAQCNDFNFKYEPITPNTTKSFNTTATRLGELYQNLASGFAHKTIMVPLGDDFDFVEPRKFMATYESYKNLIDYWKRTPEFNNIQAQFGTVSDYFNFIRQEELPKPVPKISGDFFPYLDMKEDYWTGYFTSHPFHKRMDRIVQSELRAADILTVFAAAKLNSPEVARKFMGKLLQARRDLALFQHHDAITGTSEPQVMEDYLSRLANGLNDIRNVHAMALQSLMAKDSLDNAELRQASLKQRVDQWHYVKTLLSNYVPVDKRVQKRVWHISNRKKVRFVVFNSIPYQREQTVSVVVDHPWVIVSDGDGNNVAAQLNPVLDNSTWFEIVFVAKLEGLQIKVFQLAGIDLPSKWLTVADVYGNSDSMKEIPNIFKKLELTAPTGSIGFSSTVTLHFLTNNGSLHDIELPQEQQVMPVQSISSIYGEIPPPTPIEPHPTRITRRGRVVRVGRGILRLKELGGAYIFTAKNGSKKTVSSQEQPILLLKGPIIQTAEILTNEILSQTFRIANTALSKKSFQIELRPNLEEETNADVTFEINFFPNVTSRNQAKFYTDSNGLQFLKRSYKPTFPISANFYPLASAAILETAETRATLVTGQPHSTSNQDLGAIEVMIDRVHNTNDNKGLSPQGLMTSIPSVQQFAVVVEKRKSSNTEMKPSQSRENLTTYATWAGHSALADVLYPFPVFGCGAIDLDYVNSGQLIDADFPCDFELVNLRLMEDTSALLILRRLKLHCSFESPCSIMDSENKRLGAKKIFETNLTGTQKRRQVERAEEMIQNMKPMDIRVFRIIMFNE